MNTINSVITWLADLLLAPFATVPLVGLLIWSVTTGVAMTYIFGKTSNQKALRHAVDQARAQLLAIRLFKDDLNVTFRCQLELAKAISLRLLHSLLPTLVMIVPLTVLLIQLSLRYEHRPIRPGENVVVSLQLMPNAWQRNKDVKLQAPDNIILETESLRDAADRTLYWRIKSETTHPTTLTWHLENQLIEMPLAVATANQPLQRVANRRPGADPLDRFLHPGEPGLPVASYVQGINIDYVSRQMPIWGVDIPWWVTFFIASMLTALLARRFLHVQF